jgi:hypothetical protein
MAGKYAEACSKLDPVDRSGPFQQKVEQAKANYSGRGAADLATAYAAIRAEKDSLAEQDSALNVHLAAVEQLMWDAYDAAGLTSLKLQSGASVRVGVEPSTTVTDRAALVAWAKANGLEGLLTLYAQTVGGIVRERLLSGLPMPDGVEVRARNVTVLTRG